MSEVHRKEYLARIHLAQDYIEAHLGEELQLTDIARAACFSPFHFHRVYTSVTGETLYQFILRMRLERAATQLLQNTERSVTDIALSLGFGSSSTFARAFQNAFGLSASEFRKNCKADSKYSKDPDSTTGYLGTWASTIAPRRIQMMPSVTVKPTQISVEAMDARTLAYLRHVGPYAGDAGLFERLWGQFFQWAGPRGLMQRPGIEAICIYHDNPEITDQDKLRISLGITVEPGTQVTPPINLLEIPAGQYVRARFEIDPSEYGAAWAYLMSEWMPSSGYQPDDRPCYECYLNDPKQHPQGKHIVEICNSVKPL